MLRGKYISIQHVPQIRALGKKTHVNDQAYVEPMAARLMNRWTYPPGLWVVVQSKVDVQVRSDLHAYAGMSSTDTRERPFCGRGGRGEMLWRLIYAR